MLASLLGIHRQRFVCAEEIALFGESELYAKPLDLLRADVAEIGEAVANIAEAEEAIRILRDRSRSTATCSRH